MYIWLALLILLAFPTVEVLVMVLLAQKIGWWLLLWLIASAIAGLALIREGQFAVFGRIAAAMQQGKDPLRAMLGSGRLVLAGVLLVFPGVVSDALALLVLIWPQPRSKQPPAGSEIEVIEGDFRRED
jgi:UPF0716 protein FxsA